MSRYSGLKWLPLVALAVFAAHLASAQTSTEVDVEGYLCQEPVDAEEFQHLASTNPKMSRAAALSRFNATTEVPRCEWYERTLMIYKGALKEDSDENARRAKYLFVGGKGGVFEVLVFETPEGTETLYSWRRTDDETG
ncbi:hypothetical protein [Dichotomicrobium thermohalophilum]|uniref:Uncharacterized protein n=1 Tax=Dichotomicrobium thermohalophilum TaxID=933063 RepID=A0A397Q4T4_9HYPH|nr:hypothetical protein [Dichotomicrobium thermohalophilum]RIA55953.1 hypothetical protein BXY53_1040 [Dichotomicrobium thermohalophilum]